MKYYRYIYAIAAIELVSCPVLAADPEIIIPHSNHLREDAARTHLFIVDRNSRFTPQGGLGPGGGMSPAQMRKFYNLPSNGGSEIIAVVDAYHDPNALSDFNTFSAKYGLPEETSTDVTNNNNKVFQIFYGDAGQVPGTDPTGSWEAEESLDIEWAHAMAPNAKILLVESVDDKTFANLLNAVDAATKYVDGNGLRVRQISMSWGFSELSEFTGFDSHFNHSNGVTYFASSGDNASPGFWPGTSPYVVSAGGTTVVTDNNGNFVSEAGWKDSGGGKSQIETLPFFQNGISSIVGNMRGSPDISYNADPASGLSVYDSFPYISNGISYILDWAVMGGTSASSPALAGIANLAATASNSFFNSTQDFLAASYYNLGTPNFRDITTGNNGLTAGPGWDFVTGIGVPDGLGGMSPQSIVSPVTSGISPVNVTAGTAQFLLTVNGTGFLTRSAVQLNGIDLPTNYVSSKKLTATVSAPQIAISGNLSVRVVSGAIASKAVTLNVKSPVPVLKSLSPSKASAGGIALTMYCNGSSFLANSQVIWTTKNGSKTQLTVTTASGTELVVHVPSSLMTAAGTAKVTVVNPTPGGGTSAAEIFTIK